MTFTSKHEADTLTATLETAQAGEEQADFNPSYDNASIINSSLYNHTPSGSKSQRLSAANADEIVGLAKSLSVMPGDTINITVYGKYFTPTNTNSNAAPLMLTSIAQAFGVSALSGGEALTAYNRLDEMFGSGFFLGSEDWEDVDAPKAFLNYILFDKDFVPYDMGWDQIDESALETGSNVAHDELALTALVTQPGYIYIYVSNENDKLVDVYFDDLTIVHTLSPVIQQDDYYAFGLAFNSYQRENTAANQYLYNGKEKQDELNLGWLDYGARMYMADIGRWNKVDNYTEMYLHFSPYHYAGNNPIVNVDINGDYFTGATSEVDAVKNSAEKKRKEEGKKAIEHLFSAFDAIKNGNTRAAKEFGKLGEQASSRAAAAGETVDEIVELEKSTQEYHVTKVLGNAGKTSWDLTNQRIEMELTGDLSLNAHELKHASQFERGTTSFGAGIGKTGNGHFLYGLEDEVEAYKRQALFNPSNLPTELKNGITPTNIAMIKDSSGNQVYKAPAAGLVLPNTDDNTYKFLAKTNNAAFRRNGKTYYPGVK